MATYNEIFNAVNGQSFIELRHRIWVALLVKAKAVIADNDAPAARLSWANTLFTHTEGETDIMMLNLIGGSVAQSVDTLANVNDNTVQTAVNNAIDKRFPAED